MWWPLRLLKLTGIVGIVIVAVLTITYNNTKLFITPPQQHRVRSYNEQNLQFSQISPSVGAEAIEIISSNRTTIWHYLSNREICLRMDYVACPHPDLMGRISGSSLAVLDEWGYQSRSMRHENGTDFMFNDLYCGSYKNAWLPPGQYDVEIIVVLCNSFGLTSPMRETNFTKWLEYDFKNDCLEDPASNQLTASSSTLTIEAEVSRVTDDKEQLPEGRWRMEDKSADYEYMPLRTRYQPQGCRRNKVLPERCTVPMNETRFKAFNFVWRNDTWLEDLKQYQLDLGFNLKFGGHAVGSRTKNTVYEVEMRAHGGTGLDVDSSKRMKGIPDESKICLVGYSHSYHLIYAFWANKLGHRFIWAPAKYPSELSTEFFEQYYHIRNCTTFVIGVGQWPAGKRGRAPYSLKQWRDEMTNVVTNEDIFQIDGEIKLFLRSIHHNPIGETIGKCQPINWRSPPVIDSYNMILKKIVSNVNNSRLDYLDTTFITKPLWDSSHDWNHFPHKVSSVEALFIAYVLLVNSYV